MHSRNNPATFYLKKYSQTGPHNSPGRYQIWGVLGVQIPLERRHNEGDGVSNYQSLGCLRSRLFRCRSKKTSKLRVTGLCEGNPLVTGGFPSQMTSNAEHVSIWWRHHANRQFIFVSLALYLIPFFNGLCCNLTRSHCIPIVNNFEYGGGIYTD